MVCPVVGEARPAQVAIIGDVTVTEDGVVDVGRLETHVQTQPVLQQAQGVAQEELAGPAGRGVIALVVHDFVVKHCTIWVAVGHVVAALGPVILVVLVPEAGAQRLDIAEPPIDSAGNALADTIDAGEAVLQAAGIGQFRI